MLHRLAILLWILGICACSAPQTVFDANPDLALLRSQTKEQLKQPLEAAQAQRNLIWLCLLHADGCADVPNAMDLQTQTPLDALLRALALQSQADIGARAESWLLAMQLGLEYPYGDAQVTAAAEALARLLPRDPDAVLQKVRAFEKMTERAVQTGPQLDRWRRLRALQEMMPNADLPPWPRPEVRQALKPISRRLFTGLAALPDVPLSLDMTQTVVLGQDRPQNLKTNRYALVARDPGIFAVRAVWALQKAEPRLLVVQAQRPTRAWWNGQAIALQPSAQAGGPQVLLLQAKVGENRLDLALGIGQNAEVLELALLPQDPPPVPQNQLDNAGLLRQQLVEALLDLPAARRSELGRRYAKSPLPQMLALDLAVQPGGNTAGVNATAEHLLGLMPRHADARLQRAILARETGNPALGLQILRELAADLPAFALDVALDPTAIAVQRAEVAAIQPRLRADFGFEWAQAMLGVGNSDLASIAAENTAMSQHYQPLALAKALQIGLDLQDRPLLRRLLQNPLPEQALPVVLQACKVVQTYGEQKVCDDKVLRRLLAEPAQSHDATTFVQNQRDNRGTERFADLQLPAWTVDSGDDEWHAAQDAAIKNDRVAEQKALQILLTTAGPTLDTRQKALQAGAIAPWQPFVRDGAVLAAQADDAALTQGAATAWVLDQEIVLLLPGGGALRRVHQMVRVLQDEAADAVGEIRVPDGAELEFARTILADGAVVLPAETADKETISLRAVASGTAVEYAQVAYVAADDAATGATRLGTFLLQASDGPIALSEYIVLVPDGTQANIATSPFAPTAEIVHVNGYTAHIFRRTKMPRFRVEPRAVRPELALPSVRVTANADLRSTLEPWNEALAAFVQSRDDELAALVAVIQAVPDAQRWRKLAQRIAKTVQHNHEGAAPGRPDSALQSGKGDRAALFYTVAKKLGAEACLIRVLPLARQPGHEPPDAEDYAMELVRITTPQGAVWYDPGVEGGLVDHLRAGLRGRAGLAAGCGLAPEAARVRVPDLGEGKDSRKITVDLQWLADGQVIGKVTEQLSGTLASVVRAMLLGSTEATRIQLVAQLAGHSFGGMTLVLADLNGLSENDTTLELTYTVQAAADAQRKNVLDLGLYGEGLAQSYAGLADRHTRLLYSHTLDVDLTVNIHSAGQQIDVPSPVEVAHPRIQYARTAANSADVLQIKRHLRSRPAVIELEEYASFARALREIDAADGLRLNRK